MHGHRSAHQTFWSPGKRSRGSLGITQQRRLWQMFQRKLMAVLGLAAVVALTAGESQASLSRVEGMSLTVPQLSQFTDDYVNIYYYPASVVRQNNLVLAELGSNAGGTASDGTVFATGGVTTDEQSFTVIRNFPRIG